MHRGEIRPAVSFEHLRNSDGKLMHVSARNSKPSGSQTHVPLILSPEFQKQFAYEASVQKPKPKSKFTPYRSS